MPADPGGCVTAALPLLIYLCKLRSGSRGALPAGFLDYL